MVSQRVTCPGSGRDQQLPPGSLAVTPPGHPSLCPRNLPLHWLPLIVSLSCQEQLFLHGQDNNLVLSLSPREDLTEN